MFLWSTPTVRSGRFVEDSIKELGLPSDPMRPRDPPYIDRLWLSEGKGRMVGGKIIKLRTDFGVPRDKDNLARIPSVERLLSSIKLSNNISIE